MKSSVPLLFFVLIACVQSKKPLEVVPGVSKEIADYRKASLNEINYAIEFSIPPEQEERISGKISIQFDLVSLGLPLIIDFNSAGDDIRSVANNSGSIDFIHENEHIVIEPKYLNQGKNEITIDFKAGELSLNRQPEFLYTLFVPDRASTAFPCFDQPDLKATYELTLKIPADWEAVANSPAKNETKSGLVKTIEFGATQPISTYLFSFAAGKFQKITDKQDGLEMTLYHRETDSIKVSKNVTAILDLHRKSLKWMEDYTGISYPFEKFDFAAIPSFQYGGMEHPGAILYRARSLWLDETATQNQYIGRASLIAHETAHMWFGNLVTMKWFDDVWMKEVFANFMADKIVNPSFPDVDHDLKFLVRHFPSAYEVDRSQGANSIRQPLENLKQAGMMYGAIIYNKAPIMMKKLENTIGEDLFREGLQEYLSSYSYGNADWLELIEILDKKTEQDLKAWSNIWISNPGMPVIAIERSGPEVTLTQTDPFGEKRLWMQELKVLTGDEQSTINFDQPSVVSQTDQDNPSFVVPNSHGLEYGSFILDQQTVDYLLVNLDGFDSPHLRGIIYLDLFETFINGQVNRSDYWTMLMSRLKEETDTQLIEQLLKQMETVFWRFLGPDQRINAGDKLLTFIGERLNSSDQKDVQAAFFKSFKRIATSKSDVDMLFKLWNKELTIDGLTLSENDFSDLAFELAVREHESASSILGEQLNRISNPDRTERFKFIMPALSADEEIRDRFFQSLKDAANREVEPWVVGALRYFHHPSRSDQSVKYIMPSLEILEEIQLTGDIFFPKRWLDATFSGHSSNEAAKEVRDFLDQNPGYNPRLRQKILQSADMLFRSVEVRAMDQSEVIQ